MIYYLLVSFREGLHDLFAGVLRARNPRTVFDAYFVVIDSVVILGRWVLRLLTQCCLCIRILRSLPGAVTAAIDVVSARSHCSFPTLHAVGGSCRRSMFVMSEDLKTFPVLLGSSSLLGLQPAVVYRRQLLRNDVTSAWNECVSSVAVEVPFSFLVERLPFRALSELARSHNIVVDWRRRTLDGLCNLFSAHQCGLSCPLTMSVFDFRSDGLHVIGVDCRDSFVTAQLLLRFPILSRCRPEPTVRYRFSGMVDCLRGVPDETHPAIVVDIPIRYLVERLPFHALNDIARWHGLSPDGESWIVDELVMKLLTHHCFLCARRFPSFIPISVDCSSVNSRARAAYSLAPCIPMPSQSSVCFPPDPLSRIHKLEILHSWNDRLELPSVHEKPCAVCAT
ncbi:uncharacterized protein LAESUDRAFT_730482 [Laetiporus sulphureus 93-53]|uniref:Uncharacterized protein n=1 Tax=Laetiporus sulphureus 93-53 TaxID=1314785 RepID=A0A165C6J7_9APHY|nr:uncharacterized protein LAESUDRAFT_730482 [Laetiporus sulphureus 93-53]KZT02290.1 hypothetical protein LAESUDRAFT_730482 [Laetiporus sulphureus 93-53]